MSSPTQPEPIVDEKLDNPRILGLTGGMLFILGLIAAFLAYQETVDAAKIKMVLNAALLLALGYPMLLYVRALKKIAALEQRIKDLERQPGV